MTKLANNKLATMCMALAIFGSFVAPASATVNKDRGLEQANDSCIAVIFDGLCTGGWGVPALPDTRDTTSNSPRFANCQ